MKAVFHTLLASIMMASVPLPAFAGANVSGGGDWPASETGSAWFVGDRPIRYCVEIDSKFPVSRENAIREIEQAAKSWSDLIGQRVAKNGYGVPSEFGLLKPHLVLSETCINNTDLKFYLGIENSDVAEGKKQYSRPSMMAVRQSYDPTNRWGSGFIWFNLQEGAHLFKEWDREKSFRVGVLHELGHVLGIPHVAGTVMREDIIEALVQKALDKDPLGATIEQHGIIAWPSDVFSVNGILGISRAHGQSGANNPDSHLAFTLLFGRLPDGNVGARVTCGFLSKECQLQAWDDKEKKTFKMGSNWGGEDPEPPSTIASVSAHLFKIPSNDGFDGSTSWFAAAVTAYSMLELSPTSQMGVMLEANHLGNGIHGPVVIRYFGKDGPHFLFTSTGQIEIDNK